MKLQPAASDPNSATLQYEGGIEIGSSAQPIDAFELQKLFERGR